MKNIWIKILLLLIFVISLGNYVNAAAPILTDATGSVDENSANGFSVLTHTGSDSDGDIITYDIISGNTGSVFSINTDSAEITVSGSLDYESLNQYLLTVQATASGETDTATITIDINDIDEKQPIFDSFTLSSDNSKNSNFAKIGDKILISLNISPADTWKSGNNGVFSIGSTTGLNTGNFTFSDDPITTRNKKYTILENQNGTLEFTELNFEDKEGNTLTGFTSPYLPNSNIIVDTIAPVINFSDDVVAGPVQSDTLNIIVTDLNTDTGSYQYAFTDDTTCTGSVSFTESFTSGVDIVLNDESHNDKYICVKAEDAAGNISYLISSEKVNIDVTVPTILNSNIISNNTNSGSWAKVGDEITLTIEFSEEVNSPELMILNNTGSVVITQSGSSNIYFGKYITTSSDTEGEINYSINTTDISGNILSEVSFTTDSSKVIFDRTSPNFEMTIWDGNNQINMDYKVFGNFSDPGTENISDNLDGSGSLTGKTVVAQDNRPSPGPNVSGNYTINYSLSDVAGNSKSLTRYVYIRGAGTGKSSKKMDVCNETNGDKSGDYYDGKCLKDEIIKEENNIDKKEELEEDKVEKNNKNISEVKENSLIKYTKEDIKKYDIGEENVIKYKNIIEKQYGEKISKISEEKIKIVLIRINSVLETISKKNNISEEKRKLYLELLIGLKEILLSK